MVLVALAVVTVTSPAPMPAIRDSRACAPQRSVVSLPLPETLPRSARPFLFAPPASTASLFPPRSVWVRRPPRRVDATGWARRLDSTRLDPRAARRRRSSGRKQTLTPDAANFIVTPAKGLLFDGQQLGPGSYNLPMCSQGSHKREMKHSHKQLSVRRAEGDRGG
jgi:hypothetical protein